MRFSMKTDPKLLLAYLSLGSNLGARVDTIQRGIELIASKAGAVRKVSSIYETEPVDFLDQPLFLNCVLEIETALSPLELLRRLQEIEAACGRVRGISPAIPKGPRTLDIDILLYGDLVMRSEELTIPHPRMCERRFVLQPLAELAPQLQIPGTNHTVASALALLPLKPVVRRLAE